MFLDDNGHVQWTSPSVYDLEKLEEFEMQYRAALVDSEPHQYELKYLRAVQAVRVKRDTLLK